MDGTGPRSVGGILDGAMRLYLGNLSPLLGIAVAGQVVGLALALTGRPEVASVPAGMPAFLRVLAGGGAAVGRVPSAPALIASELTLVVVWTLLLGTAAAAAASPGRPRPSGVEWAALGRIWPVFVAQFVVAVLVGLGSLLLVVPGILLGTWWAVAPVAAMVEGRRALAALGRSRALVRGLFWHAFGAVVLGTLVYVAVFAALLSVSAVLVAVLHSRVATVVWSVLLGAFLQPWLPCLRVTLYHDLLARKEGTDLLSGLEAGGPGPAS